jgi:hypothetical protein
MIKRFFIPLLWRLDGQGFVELGYRVGVDIPIDLKLMQTGNSFGF